jgi:hypothetical protein
MCTLFVISSEAQIIDRTKNKAKNKTNNRIENKIDRGIDKGLDGIEGLFKKKNKDKGHTGDPEEAPSENPGGGFGFGNGVEINETFEFDHQIDYMNTSTSKKGKETYEQPMTYLLSDDSPAFGMVIETEEGKSRSVFDFEERRMITLTNSEGMKVGMVIDMDPEQWEAYADEEDDTTVEDYSIEKTGNSKKILGYNCDEWLMEAEDMTSRVWATEELDIDLAGAFKAMAEGMKKKNENFFGIEYPSGAILETESVDNKSGDVYHMVATEIRKNSPSKVNTEGYQFYSLGGNSDR